MSQSHGRPLPLTHYDRILRKQPELAGFIATDVAKLRSMDVGSISSVDTVPDSAHSACMEFFVGQMIAHAQARTGLPAHVVRTEIRSVPEFKSFLFSLNQDYHTLLNFELAGRKTFYFSDNLTDHLLATGLNIDADLVRLPFDTCMFVFTADAAVDAVYALHGQQQPDFYGKAVSVFLTSLPDDDDHHPGCRKIIMTGNYWKSSDDQGIAFKREIAIRPGWGLDDALRTDWKALGEATEATALITPDDDSKFYTDGLALFRLCLNAALYLGSSDPDIVQRLSGRDAVMQRADSVKSSAKAKKIRSEAKRESALDFASVGEAMPPIRVTKQSGRDAGALGLDFREFAARFVVRGHWRNQACGPGLSERRLLWIKPYYKGPEMTELVNRPYVVR